MSQIRVGLLGVGLMGSAVAHRLLERDIAVIAWDRSPEPVRELERRGGEPAGAPRDVVHGASVVITMLPTADVILDVVEPLLAEWPENTVWLQMSSVGADGADELSLVAGPHGVRIIDAPVSDSTGPAEQGQLTILASGPGSARTARRADRRRLGVARALGGRGRDGLAPGDGPRDLHDGERRTLRPGPGGDLRSVTLATRASPGRRRRRIRRRQQGFRDTHFLHQRPKALRRLRHQHPDGRRSSCSDPPHTSALFLPIARDHVRWLRGGGSALRA
jgi:hypothetical protein